MDMVAARISTLPYVPTWELIAMASSRLSLPSASGFPLSQCFLPLGALAKGCDSHNQLANWSVALDQLFWSNYRTPAFWILTESPLARLGSRSMHIVKLAKKAEYGND